MLYLKSDKMEYLWLLLQCTRVMQPATYCIQLFSYRVSDTSGRTKPIVDMKTKVAFQYKLSILKRNFCFHVNDRFGPI